MEFTVESLETPALTKAQLADLLFEQIGLNKRESKDMVDAFLSVLTCNFVFEISKGYTIIKDIAAPKAPAKPALGTKGTSAS